MHVSIWVEGCVSLMEDNPTLCGHLGHGIVGVAMLQTRTSDVQTMVRGSSGREAPSTTWSPEQDQPLRLARRDLAVDSKVLVGKEHGTCVDTGDAGRGGQATATSWKGQGWAEGSGSTDGRLHMMAGEVEEDHVVRTMQWEQASVGHVSLGYVAGVDRWKMRRELRQSS